MNHYRDQVGYTPDAVEALIPAVWDESFILDDRPAKAVSVGIRTKSDPRSAPEWILACADVQVGYRRAGLSHVEKECLRNVYHLGYGPGQLGATWSVPAEDVAAACDSGIRKISDHLSGRTAP